MVNKLYKMKNLYLFYAIAILAFFSACSAEEGLEEYTVDETRGSVKTEFTISFPSKATGGTRMTTETVQATGNFRGIQEIKLFPLSSKVTSIQADPSAIVVPEAITLTAGTAASIGPSGSSINQIESTDAFYSGNNAHIYQDVEIEVGTKSFLFYGMAIPGSGGDFANGNFVHHFDDLTPISTLEDITFSPKQIYEGSLGPNAAEVVNYLTSIVNTPGWSTTNNLILSTLYQKFILMKAGSWASVKGAVQQLYSVLYGKTFNEPALTTLKETLISRITATPASDTGGGAGGNEPDGILEFLDLGNFPADIGLPDGAIYMYCQDKTNPAEGKEFKMLTAQVTDNTGLNITDVNRYAFPAPLYYRVLSDIRTSPSPLKDIYAARTVWDDGDHTGTNSIIDAYYVSGTGDEVVAGTRSIAIEKQVQYAVARLDITTTTTRTTSLLDSENTPIPLTRSVASETVNCFPVTGILVGNQRVVDYEFKPVASGTPTLYTLYDKIIEGNKYIMYDANPQILTDNDKIIHSLAFETPVASPTITDTTDPSYEPDNNAVVKIAVEFLNNSGQLFAGLGGNIIYPGGKFYLVGTFDPYLNTTVQDANSQTIKQVFLQDYTTRADLIIQSLRNAYNTLPDLREPNLELGLSVNLQWQQGIQQTINIQ